MNLTIISASFHRNGISGEGFTAVIFDDAEQGIMIASLFDEPGYCAVYKIDELVKGNIGFAEGNSWRGDNYAVELRPLVAKFLLDNGTLQLRQESNQDMDLHQLGIKLAKKDGITSRDGLLYINEQPVGILAADILARKYGFLYAEQLVNALKGE